MRGGESFGERILREMLENITENETYMDTMDFDARNEEKSRSVCERIHAEHAGRELSERERRILDMWPKFEDGAPLMYEDEFQLGGEAHTAYGFNFGVYGRVSIGVEQGSHVRLPNGERVKRPEPKVLDADGVEIHVGDTVYELETGEEYKVERVFSGTTDPDFPDHSIRCNKVADCITHAFKPDQLTHRHIVLDADGVEVHVGDTVYEPNGQSGIVIAVHPSTRCVDLRQDGCYAYAMDTQRLTHTRPDSWERLEEDIAKYPCIYAEDVNGSKFDSCSDCPWHSDCGGARASEVMARDIVRRAKALAKVEVE